MNREIEEKEHRMTKILNHNENSKVSNQPRKERPITSIQPNRGQKKLIVDHSIENNEDKHCSIKTYNNYVNDQPKHEDFYENEFNNGEVHSPETDDIIGMMNDRNSRPINNVSKFGVNSMQKKSTYPSYADQKQNTKANIENQEFDYLDYQWNIDNLKKISDEQSKYDNLGGDLDSYFSGLNSLLGKRQGTNPVPNYQPSSNIEDLHQDNKPRNINEVVDIYKELGLPKLPDELPKLESLNYRNVIPNYKSSYGNENLENENPNINFAANYYDCSKEDAFNPDIDSILNPKLSQNLYNKNMISEIPSWRDAKLVLNNQQNPHVSYDMYEEAPRSLPVTTSYGVSKYSGNTVLQQNKFDVNYKNNDLIDHDFHEEERMQAPVPYSVNQTQSNASYMYAQSESYRAPEPNKSVIPPKPMCFADVLKNQTKPQVASEGRSIFIKPSVPINNASSQVSQI